MTLADYIRQVGPQEFAKRFRITERAATAYMYGARRPRPHLAEKIVKGTPVDWSGIYAAKSGH